MKRNYIISLQKREYDEMVIEAESKGQARRIAMQKMANNIIYAEMEITSIREDENE